MKRFILLIFLFVITMFTQNVFAEDVYKITAANFDISNSFIVLNIQDETTKPVLNSVKIVKLENPKRIYFDIPSAVLTIPKQDWTFNSSEIKEVKISQFSTNPNVVRVVLYCDNNFDPSSLKFLRIKNNIIIKSKTPTLKDDYFHLTYRDEHSSASDFYEHLSVEIPNETIQEDVLNQIQQAFNNTLQQTPKLDNTPLVKKELKLNTTCHINQITPRSSAVLLSGIGKFTIEKPVILKNPSRIVYDIPNATADKNLRNQEYQLSETDSVKIGQFQVNKVRIVITTPDVTNYIPIFSTDNQSVLIANLSKLNYKNLFNNTCDIVSYNLEKISSTVSAMTLYFNHPVVHAVNRTNNTLLVYLFNAAKYNDDEFTNVYKNTKFNNIKLLNDVGMKLNIPIQPDSLVNTYFGADGKSIKIQITDPKIAKPPVKKTGAKRVVIDPGHGGSDCGALRDGINEKDIVLDISNRVKNILIKQGYQVEMTRDTDKTVSLQERVEISENFEPDIFVSIHVNASEKPEITGIETHYYRQESLSLAQSIHSAMISNINSKNRGLFKSKFYVINHTTAPAILVEIGFLSNTIEREELISDKRKQMTAQAIAEGVKKYFEKY